MANRIRTIRDLSGVRIEGKFNKTGWLTHWRGIIQRNIGTWHKVTGWKTREKLGLPYSINELPERFMSAQQHIK